MSSQSNDQLNGRKKRILVVDAHPIVRRGLALSLVDEADIEVCGDADSVADALREADSLRPDLVVAGISLKDCHGLELITQLNRSQPETRILVWSMFDEMAFAERVLRAGAAGYISKQESVEDVMDAIRRVLRGEIYLSPRMNNYVLSRLGRGETIQVDPISNLTDRELEIFELIGQGVPTRQIARKLKLSPKTIETHREKIKAKLDIRNAAELSRRAVEWVLNR